jgi:hypothetical protein
MDHAVGLVVGFDIAFVGSEEADEGEQGPP